MKHGKRFISLFLALLLAVSVAIPALPGVGDALGAAITAKAAGQVPLSQKSDDFDLETEIRNAKHIKSISATEKLHDWQYVNDYEVLKTLLEKDETTYIRLSGNIWKQQKSDSQNRNPDGVGKIYDHCILIKNNKVLDLNGYKLEVEDYYNAHQSALFYVIKESTTLILLDSSAAQTGKIYYHSDQAGTDYVFRHASVEDLFRVHDASVYVLGGTYQAGRAKQQDVYSGWEKFVGIASAVISSAISIGSQALDVYTSITSGGTLGSTGVLSSIKDAFSIDSNDITGFMSNMVSKGNKDGGKTGAQAPTITNPLAGGANVEPEVDDLNGRTANTSAGLSSDAAARERTQGTADTAAQGGSGSSIAMDSLGIYVKTTTGDTYVYSEMVESTDKQLNKDNPLKKGDEIDVLKEKDNEGVKWYLIKYKDKEAYVKPDGFKTVATAGQISNTGNILENGLKAAIQTFKKDTEKGGEGQSSWSGILEAGTEGMNMVTKSAKVLENAVMGVVNAVKTYNAKWYQVHWGTCFDLRDDAQLVILDGNFAGYGQGVKEREDKTENGKTLSWVKGECDIRDEVIDCSLGGEVWVMGGNFYGMCGANIFNAGPLNIPANKTKIHVRGGYFNCSSVNRIRGLEPVDKDKSVCIAGSKGQVNLPVEAFGKDLVRDGRIQLTESTGVGNLVVKNRSVNQNKITYSLYCAEEDLPHLNELTVSPNQSEYMENTFFLQGNAAQDHVLEGQEFIYFTMDDMTAEHAFVAPKVNAENWDQVVAGNEKGIEEAIYNTDAWYYKYPKTDFLKNLRVDDRQSPTSSGRVYDYISDLRIYTYTLHQLDPVTLEELGAPLAVKTVPSAKVFTGQLYLVPVPSAELSNGNNYYLYDGWQPGAIYKVTMAVDEILDVGSPDKTKKDDFGASKRVATVGTTSLIIKCRDTANGKGFTPMRFTDTNVGVGDTAQVRFVNAQVGRVDLYGQKLFSVQYNWRLTGTANGETFDIPLVTDVRHDQDAGDIPIEGHIYDDWEYQHKYHRNYLTSFNSRGVAVSIRPYWGSSDTVTIPETVTVNGEPVSTAGKQLYCRVTYGLCYYRWAKAFKTLPITEFPAVEDAAHASDNAASDVRQTAAQCTYETVKVTVKPTSQSPSVVDTSYFVDPETGSSVTGTDASPLRMGDNGNYHIYVDERRPTKVPSAFASLNTKLEQCNNEKALPTDTYARILNGETVIENNKNADQVVALAKKLSQGGYSIPVFYRQNFSWYKKSKNTGSFEPIFGVTLPYYYSHDPKGLGDVLYCKADEKCVVYKNGAIASQDSSFISGKSPTIICEPVESVDGYVGDYMLTSQYPERNGSLEKYGWAYDFGSRTLILKNMQWDSGASYDDRKGYYADYNSDTGAKGHQFLICFNVTGLKIQLEGDNLLRDWVQFDNDNKSDNFNALLCPYGITFTGTGSLDIQLKADPSKYKPQTYGQYVYPINASKIDFYGTGSLNISITDITSDTWKPANIAFIRTQDVNMEHGQISFNRTNMKGDASDFRYFTNYGGESVNWDMKSGYISKRGETELTAAVYDGVSDGRVKDNYTCIMRHDHTWNRTIVTPWEAGKSGSKTTFRCTGCGMTEDIYDYYSMDPKELKAYNMSEKQLIVMWTECAQADRYELYRATDRNGPYKLLTSMDTSGTNILIGGRLHKELIGKRYYVDNDVTPGVEYHYLLKVVRTSAPEAEALGYCTGKAWNRNNIISNQNSPYTLYLKAASDFVWIEPCWNLYSDVAYFAESATHGEDWDFMIEDDLLRTFYNYKTKENYDAAKNEAISRYDYDGWIVPVIGVACEYEAYNSATGKWEPLKTSENFKPAGLGQTSMQLKTDKDMKIRAHWWFTTEFFADGEPYDPTLSPKVDIWPFDGVYEEITYYNVKVVDQYPQNPVYHFSIVNGSVVNKDGMREGGARAVYAAPPADDTLAFDKWVITKGNGSFIDEKSPITVFFFTGNQDCEITATYKTVDPSAHAVTVNGGVASPAAAVNGATVTVTATEPAGKYFKEWQVVKGGVTLANVNNPETTFVMGYDPVEITAVFDNMQYAVEVRSGKADKQTAAMGETVTVTADAAPAGMVFDRWEIVAGNPEFADVNKSTATFKMGTSDVKVAALYKTQGGAAAAIGDVDGNGEIQPGDARLALRISLGLMKDGDKVMTEDMVARSDVDGKDGVQPADARLILRKSLGLNVKDEGWIGD